MKRSRTSIRVKVIAQGETREVRMRRWTRRQGK